MGRIDRFKKYLGEGLLIVFSVLFALFIDYIVEHRNLERQKQTALNGIRNELDRNSKIVSSWRIQHHRIKDRLDSLLTGKNDSLLQVMGEESYLNLGLLMNEQSLIAAVLSDTAWESAKSTNIIAQFDFETLERLTSAYKMQHIVSDETIKSILNLYFSREAHEMQHLEGNLFQLQLRFTELVGQEYLMEELYKVAINSLE